MKTKQKDQLQDKNFTFGSKGSTSGRLMPEFYVRDTFGAKPDDFFSRVGFSGNHTRTLRLVEAGTYDEGALNFQVWEKELGDGNIDANAVQVIWNCSKASRVQGLFLLPTPTMSRFVKQLKRSGFSINDRF
jgi:ABC-type phosphate/phosphonate transport system substrate-binding protein